MHFLWTRCSVFYAGGGDCKVSIGAFNSSSDYATEALGSVSDPRYFLFLVLNIIFFFSFVSILYNLIFKLEHNALLLTQIIFV